MNFKTFVEAMSKADVPTYLRKKMGEKPLTMADVKAAPKDSISHPDNLAKARGAVKEEVEEIDETANAGLAAKADKSGVSIGILRKVYNRGMAAWKSGHRPGTTPQQWAMARVNSYIGKGSGTYHGADKDLREEELDEKSDQAKRNKTMKNMMDASRGARHKLNNLVPDAEPEHKTARAHNVAIGRALRNEEAEELEEGRMKDIATNAQETDRLKKQSVPFDGPYTKTPATTTDKSGAVHSAMSRARHLAKQAMKNVKEEAEELDEISLKTMQSAKDKLQDKAWDAHQDDNKYGAQHYAGRAMSMLAKIKKKQKVAKEEVELDEKIIVDKDGKQIGGMNMAHHLMSLPTKVKPSGNSTSNSYKRPFIIPSQRKKPDAPEGAVTKEEVEEIDEISLDTMKSAKEKLKDKAFQAHMDDNKYGAQHYAGRAVNMASKIKQKERQVAKEEVEVDESVLDDVRARQANGGSNPAGKKFDTKTGKPLSGTTLSAVRSGNSITPVSARKPGESAIQKSSLSKIRDRMNSRNEQVDFEEQAPVAPVPDKKYIKGTPENKAYKATKKPINGMPTNAKCEELTGNQHKIDKNKNGKIDAHDFKLLRKEEEQLDELSKGTLGSYIKKASNDMANKGAALGKKQADADEVDRYTNRHMPNQFDARDNMKKAVGASQDDINKARSGAIKRNKNIGKAVDRLSKEEFENGELQTMTKTYKQFVESLNEYNSKDGVYRNKGTYGGSYKDPEGDDEEKPKTKPEPTGEKRGRGRPAGAKSGARQGGSAVKTKNGADYTGYKLHLPNKN